MSSMCKAARVPAFSFHFYPLSMVCPKKNYDLNKTKENNWATGFHQTIFCAAIMETANNEKGQDMSPFCVCLCVAPCPFLPVKRTLIALALQLGDFHFEENFGFDKDSIF